MMTLIFSILMIWIFGKLIGFAFRAAWGVTKILFTFLFLPVVLIALVIGGLIYIALPLLLIIGVVGMIFASK
ncbi:hypothetical protein ACTNEW_05565 [Blautia sp. HCP3S3_G3]|uniref:hypothetical protein n=1 Tax=Blautia sp. HCP3S3_G3 TaxID=3438913 RepID=UPI003F8C4208